MPDLTVAAIQMDARVGEVQDNLAHATGLVEQAAARGARLVVLPELFNTGYEYTDDNFHLPEPVDGLTGTWIVETARRLGVHLVGSFPARIEGKAIIVAMLAAPMLALSRGIAGATLQGTDGRTLAGSVIRKINP